MIRRLFGALLISVACSRQRASTTPDAGGPPADASTGPISPAFHLSLRTLDDDGGFSPELAFEPDIRPLVDPVSQLELSTNAPMHDYRIRLFDEAERVVESNDQLTELETGVSYRLSVLEPLKAGRNYALVIDAERGDSIKWADGGNAPDQRLEFQVSGAKAPLAPTLQPAKRRRHRHASGR